MEIGNNNLTRVVNGIVALDQENDIGFRPTGIMIVSCSDSNRLGTGYYDGDKWSCNYTEYQNYGMVFRDRTAMQNATITITDNGFRFDLATSSGHIHQAGRVWFVAWQR